MKVSVKRLLYALTAIFLLASINIFAVPAHALTTGETYTVTIDRMTSTGTLTSTSGSATAVADSDGKISFSLSGVPTSSTCNFMVINIKDSGGTVVRRSLVPCPAAGGTLPLGVSELTGSQTDALLDAFAAAGIDDPILAVFGYTLVRSTGITALELSFMANLANQGINGTNGFVDYLTSNGVSTSQLAAYRSAIVAELADPDTGYSKLYKDSVDAATATTEQEKRGEAAALLLNILVKSATTAGFDQDRVLEAFNAMGAIVVPLMDQGITDGDLSAATGQMIDSSIGGGIQKLNAERQIEKYSAALTTLGASGADLTAYQSASTTLVETMIGAFQTYEQVFDGNETDTEIQSAETAMNTTMNASFDQFLTDTGASDARINAMIVNIDNALGSSTGLTVSEFQYYKSDGSSTNWPVTMVIPTDWISSLVAAGGGLTYTRDTTAIPSSMEWVGTCSNSSYFDRTTCESNGGTWTSGRTDFEGDGIPTSYAVLFSVQEDIMILEFSRWDDQSSAGADMTQQAALEKAFSDAMDSLAGNVTGTTDGTTAITAGQKSAFVTLMQSPQF